MSRAEQLPVGSGSSHVAVRKPTISGGCRRLLWRNLVLLGGVSRGSRNPERSTTDPKRDRRARVTLDPAPEENAQSPRRGFASVPQTTPPEAGRKPPTAVAVDDCRVLLLKHRPVTPPSPVDAASLWFRPMRSASPQQSIRPQIGRQKRHALRRRSLLSRVPA